MVDDWAYDASSNTDIFWLEGLAGTGKSTISRTVADKLQKQGKLAASFFFKRGAGDRANGRRFFTTVACQLAGKLPSMFDHVAAVLNEVHDISSKNIERQFEALLEKPFGLQEGETRSGDLIIVIDALDECEPSDLGMILPRLARTKLKCFITSRPGIQSTLYSEELGEGEKIYLHKLDESVTKEDIRKYLNFELAKLKKKYLGRRRELPREWPDGDILNGLADLANPLFIAAATILRMLDAKHISKSPIEMTQDILGRRGNGLKGIESIYNQVLAELPPEFADTFRQVVGPIIIMFDHLNTMDLSSLLGMSEWDVDHCISQLEEILDTSDPQATIRPFHLSLPDFLLGPSPRHEFRIDRQSANRQMASHCIRLLHKNLQKDICSIGSPGCRAGEISSELIAECLQPPVQYACLYWIDHLKACGDQLRNNGEAHALLQATFPMWLEALSWMGRLDESRRMIYDLQQVTDSSAVDLTAFLEECRMFVSVFLPGIREAPLQVYHAGLVFTPTDSLLGQAFSGLCSSEWNVQVPLMTPNLSSSLHSFTSRQIPTCMTISDDGFLAWGEEFGGIQVIDSAAGKLVREIEWPHTLITQLAFGAEGQLAAASEDETRVWDLKTGKLMGAFSCGVRELSHSCLTFSKLDDLLCILLRFSKGSKDALVSKYDWKSGVLKAERSVYSDKSVCLSPDGDWIGLCSGAAVQVLAFSEGPEKQDEFYPCEEAIEDINFSTDGMLLAATKDLARGVIIWSRETGTVLREIDTHSSTHPAIVLTQSMIVIGFDSGNLGHYSLTSGSGTDTKVQQIVCHKLPVYYLAISERCRILASASWGRDIRIWDSSVFPPSVQDSSGDASKIRSMEFGHASKTLVSTERRGATIWNATDGSLIQSINLTHGSSILAAKAAPFLAVCPPKGHVISLWDPTFQELQHEYTHPSLEMGSSALALSADGERLLSVTALHGDTCFLCVHNLKTNRSEWETELKIRGGGSKPQLAFYVDRSSTRIAIGTRRHERRPEIYTLDTSSHTSGRYELDGLKKLAFLSNGTQIMAMSGVGSGWVRDFEDGTVLFEFEGPKDGLYIRHLYLGSFEKATIPDKAYPRQDQLSALINSHHVSWDRRWIMNGAHRSLWLPEDFHEPVSTTSDSSLALYTEKRGLWILHHQEHQEHAATEENG